jgi:Uma2 family endonuclease
MTFLKDTPPANLTPVTTPLPEIHYPDSDGLPMSDNTLQFEWITLIKENLDWLFADNPDVFVAGDLLWYPVEGDPKIRQAPDTLVAFGRPKGYRGSYKQWQEDGIAPQVVFEILSPGNRRGEMNRKLMFYQQYGVEEYYLYDPDNNLLEGWCRQGGILDWIEDLQDWVSPRLGIRFDPSAQPLVIYRPDGEPFLSFEARSRQAEQDKLRAEQEAQRAEQEHQRAEQERQRADRLAAHLASLGINPDRIP